MSLLKKLAGETMVYGLSSILGRLLNYVILTPYLTREFTNRAEYGIVTELYAYIALLLVFFTYRMETTFFRYGNQKEHADRVFSTAALSVMISTAFLVALFIGLSGPIASFLDYPDHPEYIVLFTLILAADAVSAIPFARLRLENRPMRFAVIRLVNIAANIALIFFFMELCPWLLKKGWNNVRWIYDPENRVIYVFLANFLASFLAFLMLLPLLFRMKWKMDLSLLRTMLLYAAPLVIAGFAGAINQMIGNPMLKYFTVGSLQDKLVQVGLFRGGSKDPDFNDSFHPGLQLCRRALLFQACAPGRCQSGLCPGSAGVYAGRKPGIRWDHAVSGFGGCSDRTQLPGSYWDRTDPAARLFAPGHLLQLFRLVQTDGQHPYRRLYRPWGIGDYPPAQHPAHSALGVFRPRLGSACLLRVHDRLMLYNGAKAVSHLLPHWANDALCDWRTGRIRPGASQRTVVRLIPLDKAWRQYRSACPFPVVPVVSRTPDGNPLD
ncbi:MAG: oligosaccharide flippase family protein [Haliscomenobacter sp.]|nr:oligosaccharide flippase family protein [Haliscomenobacter sp.]